MCVDQKFFPGNMRAGVVWIVLLLIILSGVCSKARMPVIEAMTPPSPPSACTNLSETDMSQLISWITEALAQSKQNGVDIRNSIQAMKTSKQ